MWQVRVVLIPGNRLLRGLAFPRNCAEAIDLSRMATTWRGCGRAKGTTPLGLAAANRPRTDGGWMHMKTRPHALEELSPFQLKDQLIRYAKAESASSAATHKF